MLKRCTFCETICIMIVSIVTLPAFADDNPFLTGELKRQAESEQELVQNMRSGRCGGSWEGGCSDMMRRGGTVINHSDLPKPASEGAILMMKYCTQCHSLPSPSQHTSLDWTETIERMNNRMQRMSRNSDSTGIKAPSAIEFKTLEAYLQENALK